MAILGIINLSAEIVSNSRPGDRSFSEYVTTSHSYVRRAEIQTFSPFHPFFSLLNKKSLSSSLKYPSLSRTFYVTIFLYMKSNNSLSFDPHCGKCYKNDYGRSTIEC